jgi:G6PDH family F420-dependent oxidoreductase
LYVLSSPELTLNCADRIPFLRDRAVLRNSVAILPFSSSVANRDQDPTAGQTMIKLGYKLMSEEHGARDLVRNAQRAEDAGFDFAAISDHFSPWIEEQGHSPFAWSVLGAAAQATKHLGLMTAVTCPTMRYHPAVIAQAAATLGILSDDRFTLGLGSGERLNEHVVGAGWPGVSERQSRLSEALDIIQGLLGGKLHEYTGTYLKLEDARLYDRPDAKPRVVAAAGGPKAAQLAAEKADGLVATEPRADIIDAFRSAGGTGPCYAEVTMCCASTEQKGRETAHRYFRWSLTGWPVQAELPDTKGFAAASSSVTAEDVGKMISCGPAASKHLEAIDAFVDAGFNHIILVQIGPEQDDFLDMFRKELAPALRKQ